MTRSCSAFVTVILHSLFMFVTCVVRDKAACLSLRDRDILGIYICLSLSLVSLTLSVSQWNKVVKNHHFVHTL